MVNYLARKASSADNGKDEGQLLAARHTNSTRPCPVSMNMLLAFGRAGKGDAALSADDETKGLGIGSSASYGARCDRAKPHVSATMNQAGGLPRRNDYPTLRRIRPVERREEAIECSIRRRPGLSSEGAIRSTCKPSIWVVAGRALGSCVYVVGFLDELRGGEMPQTQLAHHQLSRLRSETQLGLSKGEVHRSQEVETTKTQPSSPAYVFAGRNEK
ncbi:hypothetical protein K402DRAFT_407436 [Aulographum hederae CBS 113979]|uniref:Uncharacterized protein n=1 Tax=Aulographum hederae CBS 113979 TaxID=1176131 RepID=A0A6G1GPA6_9PEZI|nr:hypothetical protein K402DRAFT_407436 [Aulographum hederae CBS 113979]